MNPADVARFLGSLRQKNRVVPIETAEALLLIAAGIDNIPDLQRAMCDTEGNALPAATISRLIASLRGKARYHQGTWVESPYSLLDVRPHPHRRGLQLQLSAVGRRLSGVGPVSAALRAGEHLNLQQVGQQMGAWPQQ